MYVVPVSWIRHVADVLGRDSPVLRGALDAAGLAPTVLEGDFRVVRVRHFVDFIEKAALLAGDDLFGLRLGESYDVRASGLSAYVTITAATMRDAMENAARYGALTDSGAIFALTEAGDVARFAMDSRSLLLRGSRHASEFRVGFVVAGARRWVGPDFRPLEVRFAHERDTSRRAVEALLGCPARFASETTEMLVGADQLDLPVSGADPYLLAVLERHAEELLARREQAQDDLRERVRRIVSRDLPKGAPTAPQVAAALNMSDRTFARRLQDEGTSFRQVIDDIRREMARSYLSDPEISLAQVAYLLGYADQSAFSNSFRRWTGQSPRRFRSERGAAGAPPA